MEWESCGDGRRTRSASELGLRVSGTLLLSLIDLQWDWHDWFVEPAVPIALCLLRKRTPLLFMLNVCVREKGRWDVGTEIEYYIVDSSRKFSPVSRKRLPNYSVVSHWAGTWRNGWNVHHVQNSQGSKRKFWQPKLSQHGESFFYLELD